MCYDIPLDARKHRDEQERSFVQLGGGRTQCNAGNRGRRTISGTPTAKAGEYKFTVECRIDNWVKNTKQYTYTVASGFVIDENEASVGEEFFGEISSETVTTQKYNDGIVYSVKEGVLPAGLSLDANGVISGTPAEAGKFTVVINVAASRSERQGWTSIKVTDNYEYEVTLTVEGDEPVADHGGIVSSAINYLRGRYG